jgi:hypothetical protein
MLSQWPKCTLPVLTRRVHWSVRIRDRKNNGTLRRSEKIHVVLFIYWPINGQAPMHVVLTENNRCVSRDRPCFTKRDHATLRPLNSHLKEALSWLHYPSVEVEGVSNKTNPSLYGSKIDITKFEVFTSVLKGVQYSEMLALSTAKHLPTFWMNVLLPSWGSNGLEGLFESLETVYQPTWGNSA